MDDKENLNFNNQPDKPTTASDLQVANIPEEEESSDDLKIDQADEAAMMAGVETVGRVSILLWHVKRTLVTIWTNPKYRYSSIAGLIAIIVLIFAIPTTRYGTLNAVGVRASAVVTIINDTTGRPVTGVEVGINGSKDKTDDQGIANLTNLRLGSQELVIDKRAYAESNTSVNISLGSNALDDVKLLPIGTQFVFSITDWLSQNPIENAKVTNGDDEALSDSDGVAILTIAPTNEEKINITIESDKFHEIESMIDTSSSANTNVAMVSSSPHYFMSRRNGQFDLLSSRLDGSEQELIIPGTGSETKSLRLSVNPDNNFGALVSTRNGIRDDNGYLQQSLHIIEFDDTKIKQIDESHDIQLIGWGDGKIIYVKIAEGESAHSPRRHRLMSHNPATEETKEIQASNHFNDVKIIGQQIFFAADDSFKQQDPKPYLYKMNFDGSDRTEIIKKQSWTIFRKDYSTIVVNSTKNGWHEFDIDTGITVDLTGQPSVLEDHLFHDSPNGKKSAWIDSRDGKGVLLVFNTETKREEIVHQAGGLVAPLRWVDDNKIIFRISNTQETADYVVDLRGGEPKKITDVSDISSATRWFYY